MLKNPESKPAKRPLGNGPKAAVTPVLKKPEIAPLANEPPLTVFPKPETGPGLVSATVLLKPEVPLPVFPNPELVALLPRRLQHRCRTRADKHPQRVDLRR
jgi:hypothetical protein